MPKTHPTVPRAPRNSKNSLSFVLQKHLAAAATKRPKRVVISKDLSASAAVAPPPKRVKYTSKTKAEKAGISLRTLYRRKKAGIPLSSKSVKLGRPTFFTPETERVLTLEILRRADADAGLKHEQLKTFLVDAVKTVAPDVDFVCSDGFIKGFLLRNPVLVYGPTGFRTRERSVGVNRFAVRYYYEGCKAFVGRFKQHEIFNIDDTGLAEDPKKPKVCLRPWASREKFTRTLSEAVFHQGITKTSACHPF